MKKMLFAMIVMLGAACLFAGAAKVAGKWQMSMDTPHGAMTAALVMKVEGTALTGTCISDHMGNIPLKGTAEGDKVSFVIEIVDGPKITFNGKVAGDKITGTSDFGAWNASRQ